jgi:transketolase
MSIIELLISLYYQILQEEDKFILSKGHACFPLYVILKEKGYNPKLQGHPSIDSCNGIYCTSGSLGHGLPIAVGMALARKRLNKSGNIYVIIGDGESQEGTTWESLLIASHYKLNNLIVIVDNNKIQGSGFTEDILSLGDLKTKFEVFGCYVREINGHLFEEIIPAISSKHHEKPSLVIANTIKGKGISFMENKPEWHSKMPDFDQLKQAYIELE